MPAKGGRIVDMKRPPEKARSKDEIVAAPDSAERYPWGLRLSLHNEELTKLGITEMPKVGDKFTVVATAEVTSVSQRERRGETDSKDVEMQIKKMGIDYAATGKSLGKVKDRGYS